jgi:hypothetical protein
MEPLLALLLMLAGPQGRSEAPDPVNACLIVTKQDAVTAMDEELRDARPSVAGRSIVPGAAASSCEYGGRGLHGVQVHVWRVRPAGAAQLKRTFQGLCEKRETGGLAGLGDAACWYSAARDEIQVLKGVTLFQLIVRRNGDASGVLKSLAKAALARLP